MTKLWRNSGSGNNGDYVKGNTDIPSQRTDRPDLKNLKSLSEFDKPNGKWIYRAAWHHCNCKWRKWLRRIMWAMGHRETCWPHSKRD